MHSFLVAAEIVAWLVTLAGLAYYVLCLWSAIAFLQRPHIETALTAPPVSILKPLKGTDPEIYQSFRRHCLQDYPEYEIIFGVNEPSDPAIAIVEQLIREFPDRAIRILVCPERLGTNLKVSNLVQMQRVAKYEHLLVNDSDIRVPADYLRRVMSELGAPGTGLVTCLYRGVSAPTLGSRLESLGISTDFCTGVLVAQQLEGSLRFGLGSTLAFRRSELQQIGGFEALADYLADDYELGRRIAALGQRVHLSSTVVETYLPAYDLGGFFRHQLRWARTIRDARRWGYVGLGLTFGLPWALLAVALHPAWASCGLLGCTLLLRLAVALVVGRRVLRDPRVLSRLWLIPLRDLAALLVWGVSFTGHSVSWRGDSFTLKDGKLARIIQ